MKILLDAMGGDNAPDANIKGAIKAIKEIKSEIVLVGNEKIIKSRIKELYGKESISEISDRITIKNATETIEMEDIPTQAIKNKKDSSMVVGFNMLKADEGDVFISAGNSGALLTGATLLVGRIKGVDRPAIAPMLPSYKKGLMLVDAGANTNCKPINLLQFAQFANIYLKNIYKMEKPAIGLLNIGALFLGVKKPVVKAHGSSDDYLFYFTIKQAEKFAESKAVEILKEEFEKMK